jgi:hypothetical protein
MSVCRGCGGVVGRDCWNPQECEWISRDMEVNYRQGEIARQSEYDNAMKALEEQYEHDLSVEFLDEWWFGAGIS